MKRLTSERKSTDAPEGKNLEDDTTHFSQPEEVEEVEVEHEIPPKQLRSYNLKKIKSFKAIRHKYKLSNQSKLFENDLQVLLNEYLPENYQLDTELLIHILNIAEHFFVYGDSKEREEQKTQSIKRLMLKYFRNDEELLNTMVSLVWHKVEKSNVVKRLFQRLKNKFFLK
jgi:hypothetical protein